MREKQPVFASSVMFSGNCLFVGESPEKLFDPFYRVESDRARQTCLETCQEIIAARNRKPKCWRSNHPGKLMILKNPKTNF
jgi:hypothetical protein